MSRSVSVFSQAYIEKCFQAWYLGGRPDIAAQLRDLIEPDELGHKPLSQTINRWRTLGAWDERADVLDAKAIEQSDKSLINKKVQLLLQQQGDAMKLAKKSLEYLLVEGFDSSSAAVQAYFRSTEEQRKLEGFSDLLERIDKLRDNELSNEILAMLQRASDNDQVIDAEGVPELPNGEQEE